MIAIGNISVKVSPEALVTQAVEVRRLATDMKRRFEILEDTMDKTKGYWLGEAGELHRKLYNEQKEKVTTMLKRLLEHPDDLLAISENYKMAENINVQSASLLDADLIQ